MQIVTQKIAPCLWFDSEAEEAAKFYVSVFKNSKINTVGRYPDEGQEIHGKPAGSVMVVDFEIAGQKFVALNGGPQFTFERPCPSRSIATAKTRSIISGEGSPRAARKAPAAGSRTDTGCHGRSFRSRCSK